MKIGIIVILSFLLRFVYLDTIPNGISGDELHYVITAKSVFLTGKDTTGTWNPRSALLFRYPPGEQQAELPYFLHLLTTGPFGFSLFWAKMPFALLSFGVVLLLYGIANRLFGNRVAWAVGLAAAVNPWLVVMGRTAYEMTPAVFFFLLALYLILILRSWNILWTFVPLMLGFYSYIGTKLIFVPFVGIMVWLAYTIHRKKYLLPYITLLGLSLLMTGLFIFQLKTSTGASRLGEILLPWSSEIAQQVNDARRTAIASPFLPLLVNKYAVYIQTITSKIFRVFSPSYLFVEGDQFFLPARQGFFYYLDFLFLITGALALYPKKRFFLGIIGLFMVIGTFPQLFHKTSGDFSAHLALMFPFLILLVGAGIAEVVESTTRRLKPWIFGSLLLVYAANVASFVAVYFYQVPLQQHGDFRMRVLSRYLHSVSTKTPVTVYSTTSADVFSKYLFYANAMNRSTMPEIYRIDLKNDFSFQGIHFTSCDTAIKNGSPSSVLVADILCDMQLQGSAVSISRLSDGGKLYTVLGDTLCASYPLTGYARETKIGDFYVEKLPEERFCAQYVHR